MPSVHDAENFAGRVNYAAQCLMRGTSGTRHFDTCFEMHDGDAVVTALVRRARNNKALHDKIAGRWGGVFPQSWLDAAAKHEALPVRELRTLAADLRRKGRESFERMMAARSRAEAPVEAPSS